MKDLDFDELDRAVASALETDVPAVPNDNALPAADMTPSDASQKPSSVSSEEPSISAHAVHSRIMPSNVPRSRMELVRTTPHTVPTQDAPTVTAPATGDPASQTTVEEAATQPASRRRIPHREGRFMDVVRPGHATALKPQPVSTAQPMVSAASPGIPDIHTQESSATNNTSLESAINELLVSEGHAPVGSNTSTEETANAPEVQASQTEAPGTELSQATALDEHEANPPVDTSLEAIAAELGATPLETPLPSVSPFLADAKVEKRPLGSAPDTLGDTEPTTQVEGDGSAELSQTVADTEPMPSTPEPETAPVPEELTEDLVAIESSMPTTEAVSKVEATESPDQSISSVVTGPASIARQYKEQPRTASDDDESGAIFDPQTYQQPIEHPAKKSSGWIWILAIIVIILLAVGAAVAAWFAGLLPVAL